jgi:predicted metal-binding protein
MRTGTLYQEREAAHSLRTGAVDLYIHCPTRLHGAVKHREKFTFFFSSILIKETVTGAQMSSLPICW